MRSLVFVSNLRKMFLGGEFNATRVSISIDLNVIGTVVTAWKSLCPKHIGLCCRHNHQ